MAIVRIDPRDRTPIYAQLERGLRAAIATGQNRTASQPLDYYCWPTPSDQYYNSNSLASGLLDAAELPLPEFFRGQPAYAGLAKPVPGSLFNPQ